MGQNKSNNLRKQSYRISVTNISCANSSYVTVEDEIFNETQAKYSLDCDKV
jgi:hypothetical protein